MVLWKKKRNGQKEILCVYETLFLKINATDFQKWFSKFRIYHKSTKYSDSASLNIERRQLRKKTWNNSKIIFDDSKRKLIEIAGTQKIARIRVNDMSTFMNIWVCGSYVQSGWRKGNNRGNAPSHKSMRTIANLFRITSTFTVFSESTLQWFFLSSGCRRMLLGNKFSDDE